MAQKRLAGLERWPRPPKDVKGQELVTRMETPDTFWDGQTDGQGQSVHALEAEDGKGGQGFD